MANNTAETNIRQSPMHLWLNTSSPDPIGFANVSGFYGPGTWAGWYLTLCASWYTYLAHEGRGFDLSTWLYLAGINWSSLDLIQHLHAQRAVFQPDDDAWMKESASIGAAFSVVWWGFLHGVVQMILCCKHIYENQNLDDMQRGLTILVGTTFPAIALTASIFMISDSNTIPALYWETMSGKTHTQGRGINYGHSINLAIPSAVGIWVLCWYATMVWSLLRDTNTFEVLKDILFTLFKPVRWLSRRVGGLAAWMVVSVPFWYIVSAIINIVKHGPIWVYFWPGIIPAMIVACIFAPVVFVAQIGQVTLAYIVAAYFRVETSPDHACFFMPCAPQSITDSDQAFSLFTGLFSFVVAEVIVPYVRQIRRDRRDRLRALQDADRRIETERGQRDAGQTSLIRDNVFKAMARGASGNDLPPVGRVNSGIRVEEGRAGQWRLNRVNSSRADDIELRRTTTF